MQKDGRIEVLTHFAIQARERGETFFYVKIPGNIKPFERGDRFEEALIEALTTLNAGDVTGGGSQIGEGDTVAFCGIDVVVVNRELGLEIIREVMIDRKAPKGTVIEEFLPSYCEHSLYS